MTGSSDLSRSETKTVATEGAAGLGAATAVAAVAVTACCSGPFAAFLGPLLVASLGVSGAATAARLAPYAPYLFAASFAAIVFGFWSSYRAKASCSRQEGAASSRRPRFARTTLWFAAGGFLISLAYTLIATGHL